MDLILKYFPVELYSITDNTIRLCYVRMEEGRSAFEILTGKPTGKRHLGRPRHRWEDNIRMDLEEIGIEAEIGFIQLWIEIIGEPL